MPKHVRTPEPALEGLPERVRLARKKRGLTVTSLGDLSQLGSGRVSRLENGQRVAGLTISSALALARALGCNVQWLLTGTGPIWADGRFIVLELTPQLLEILRQTPGEFQATAALASK